jgi:NTP pyrophosphatase (non-canonical NTP hydrolase)
MKTWSERVSDWAIRTFGKAEPLTALNRFEEELIEFSEAVIADDSQKAVEEAADMVITLCNWARANGYDLAHQVERKFFVNEHRNWNCHGDGTGNHIKVPGRDEYWKREFDAGHHHHGHTRVRIPYTVDSYQCSCGSTYQLRTVSHGIQMCADCMAGIP